MSFGRRDLEHLNEVLYSRADRVVPMRDIYKGDTDQRVIGLRHDVDDNPGSFDTALAMAEWEMRQGYSSTYFLLHDSHYWTFENLSRVPTFTELGHEVGIHVNALAEGLRQKRAPHAILWDALVALRAENIRVVGAVAHGDPLCYLNNSGTGRLRMVNDEMFEECARSKVGDPDRIIQTADHKLRIEPAPLSDYGLEYEANWLPRGNYLSDSGRSWSQPVDEVAEAFGNGQLHMLVHPDWWANAFVGVTV